MVPTAGPLGMPAEGTTPNVGARQREKTMISIRRRALSAAAVAAVALAGLIVPAAAGASLLPTVNVVIGTPCVEGLAAPHVRVQARLLTRAGKARGNLRAKSDADGNWSGCFVLSGGLGLDGVNGSDRIRLRSGNGATRLVKVPRLVVSIKRVRDVITGRFQPGGTVDVSVLHQPGFAPAKQTNYQRTANDRGHFKLNLHGKVNLIGGDIVAVNGPYEPPCDPGLVCELPPTDHFAAMAVVPYVMVSFGSNRLAGWAVNTENRFKLRDAAGNLKGASHSNALIFGLYLSQLVDRADRPAYVAAGDVLSSSFADDAHLRVPGSSLVATASTKTVTGRCMANSSYQLTTDLFVKHGKTSANGAFSRTLSALERGEFVTLTCRYPTGDSFVRTARTVK